MFRQIIILLTFVLAISNCTKQADKSSSTQTQPQTASQTQSKQDISNAAIIKIDGKIGPFADAVIKAKSAFDKSRSESAKKELVKAYLDFGNYLTYDSPLSPRQGKYHRALIEYKKVLRLDPDNEKAKGEIAQIEDIYKSMNRPIPEDDLTQTP